MKHTTHILHIGHVPIVERLVEGIETFLRGRKGRAAKNSVVTSGEKQLKC